MIEIISITGLYFLLGGILLLFTKSKNSSKWIKYFVYLGIVSSMLSIYWLGMAFWANTIIVLLGFREITLLHIKNKNIDIYLVALASFILFAFSTIYLSFYLNAEQWIKYYCLIFTFDGFSQIGGQLIGKKKLAPIISPGKTIEGLVVGSLTALITAVLIFPLTPFTLVAATLILLFALLGDLAASWYKRKMGVKDFNQIIPGHGGILDRFDSLLGAAPILLVYYLYTSGYLQV